MFAIDATDPTLLAASLDAALSCAALLAAAFDPETTTVDFAPAFGVFVFDQVSLYFFSTKKEKNEPDELDSSSSSPPSSPVLIPTVHIVSDMDDPFSALSADAVCVPLATPSSLASLSSLLLQIPSLVSRTATLPAARQQPQCGGALCAIADAMSGTGGKAYLITSAPPRTNKGAVRNRDNLNYYTDRAEEVSMFLPVAELSATECGSAKAIPADKAAAGFYAGLARSLAGSQICLDIFICPNGKDSVDVATLTALCTASSGQLHLIPAAGERAASLSRQLKPSLVRSCTRNHGNEATVKVRTSRGVKVSAFLTPSGTVHTSAGSAEVEMASFDADRAVVAMLAVEGCGIPNTPNNNMCYLQSATLFTCSNTGQRTVRVSTLALPSTGSVDAVYKGADQDAVACVLMRRAMTHLGYGGESKELSSLFGSGRDEDASDPSRKTGSLVKAREYLVTSLVETLAAYRAHTDASQSPLGQLILPQSLKLLPLFVLSMLKNPTIRPSLPNGRTDRAAPPSPRVDERAYRIALCCNAGASNAVTWAHPNVYDVLCMKKTGDIGTVVATPVCKAMDGESQPVVEECMRGETRMPPTVPPSIAAMQVDGVYLVDDGFTFYLFVGRSVGAADMTELFGFATAEGVDCSCGGGGVSLVQGGEGGSLAGRLERFVATLRNGDTCRTGITGALKVVFAGNPTTSVWEADVMALLVDDSTVHEVSYVDFLVAVHGKVRNKMKTTRGERGG